MSSPWIVEIVTIWRLVKHPKRAQFVQTAFEVTALVAGRDYSNYAQQ
jgi:hypothetical protein